MVASVDLVLFEDVEQIDVVQECHDECGDLKRLHDPPSDWAIFFAVDEGDGISFGPEVAGGWPGDVEQERDQHDLHHPEPNSVNGAPLLLRVEINLVGESFEAEQHDGDGVEDDVCCCCQEEDHLDLVEVLHESIELILGCDVEAEVESTEHVGEPESGVGWPILIVEEEYQAVEL